MSTRQQLLVEIAFLVGLPLFAALLALWPGTTEKGQLLPRRFPPTVLVAKQNLHFGECIKAPQKLFEERELSCEPCGAIKDIELLRDRVLRHSLRAGDFIVRDDLFGNEDNPWPWPVYQGLSLGIRPGHRCVGIRISKEEIPGDPAGLPKSYLDIVLRWKGDDGRPHEQLVLEEVLVVAADTQRQRDQHGRLTDIDVVTVVVKATDALKLALAKQIGDIVPVGRGFIPSPAQASGRNARTGR